MNARRYRESIRHFTVKSCQNCHNILQKTTFHHFCMLQSNLPGCPFCHNNFCVSQSIKLLQAAFHGRYPFQFSCQSHIGMKAQSGGMGLFFTEETILMSTARFAACSFRNSPPVVLTTTFLSYSFTLPRCSKMERRV